MSRVRISLDPDGKYLRLHAGPLDTGLILTIPGWKADRSQLGTWRARPAWSTALATRAVLGEALDLDPSVYAWGEKQAAREDYAATLKAHHWAIPHLPDGLFPFQNTGAVFMAQMEQVLNADEMGTGKTVQTLAAIRHLHATGRNPFPVLVVCTNSMKFTWAAEAAVWLPECTPVVLDGSKAKRTKDVAWAQEHAAVGGLPLVVVNWEGARSLGRVAGYGSIHLTDKDREPGPLNELAARTVVVDEAHRMKDPKAKQTRAVWALQHPAEYRFALTGTPVANDPGDLWAIMHGLAPDEWPSRKEYLDRYTFSGLNYWGAVETYGFNPQLRPELDRFFLPRFIRRTKAEVLPDLPPKLPPSVRWVDMQPKQAAAYREMEKEMLTWVDDELLTAADPLSKLGRLLTFAAATPVLGPKGEEGETGVVALQRPSCKVDAMFDVLEESGDESLVVFASSRLLIELCAEELAKKKIGHVLITGAQSPGERKINVDTFQHGEAQVALVTLGAGSEGITLTAASTALFLQRSWSMVQNQQAEDRLHRHGQREAVRIIDVVTRNTAEVAVHTVEGDKAANLQELVRDPAWVRRELLRAA